MKTLLQMIAGSVRQVVDEPGFAQWTATEKVKRGDVIALSDCPFGRTDLKTTRSGLRLALSVGNAGAIDPIPQVLTGQRINVEYKLFHERDPKLRLTTLPDALDVQLRDFGRLPFILIGTVADNSFQTEIENDEFDLLVVDPTCDQTPIIHDRTMTIAVATCTDETWQEISRKLGRREDDAHLRKAFFDACARIDGEADGLLRLPGDGAVAGPNFLDQVNTVLREYTTEYESALTRSAGQPGVDGYNDLLRISYNFASEASELIRLILRLADLKPVVSWGTLGVQYRLARAMTQLLPSEDATPERKASIAKYREIVGETRNSAFHHLLPFQRSLVVPLATGDLQRPHLRLFAEHRHRKQNQLLYADKELVDVLINFTHATERIVAPQFWHNHREVMHVCIELFETCANVLRTIYQSLPSAVSSAA
jgi:hypothetical protein